MNEAVSGKPLRFEWEFRECRCELAMRVRAVLEVLRGRRDRQRKQETPLLMLCEGLRHTSGRATLRQPTSGVMEVSGMQWIMRYQVPEVNSGHEVERR
jgi:hypothetical protein